MTIPSFVGKYHFLSNFYIAPAEYEGVIYPSSEAAYQAAKSLDPEERKIFLALRPGQAKRKGKQLRIRPDWENVKIPIMTTIVRDKFVRNPELGDQLLATENKELIEGNHWDDDFWGVVDGVGENNLGKILMIIRAELRARILRS